MSKGDKALIILAIDPGNIQSGYAILKTDKNDITEIVEHGKIDNEKLREKMKDKGWNRGINMLAIEMIAHYGQSMAAGATTFETCVWIGRFMETAERDMNLCEDKDMFRIYRREEKINLCGSMRAKDSDITTALTDRYTPGEKNFGKGTKANPGFFYGVAADIWQAIATGVTAFDIYVRGIKP